MKVFDVVYIERSRNTQTDIVNLNVISRLQKL